MDKQDCSSQLKVIFLDIDHVLTNTDIDGSSFKLLDPTKYRLSQENLKWLDLVVSKTGAKIVIASNWRKFTPPHDYWIFQGKAYHSQLGALQEHYGDAIIGMLPPERHTTKSECLELWFEDNSWLSKVHGKYVILEDDLREGYQESPFFAKRLILTDCRVGFTEDNAKTAIALLQ